MPVKEDCVQAGSNDGKFDVEKWKAVKVPSAEDLINALLDAGLKVSFVDRSTVNVVVEGTNVWWAGKTLDQVYEKAVHNGYVKRAW